MGWSRSQAAEQGREAVEITRSGRYSTVDGTQVDIRAAVQNAIAATRSYPPEVAVPEPSPGRTATRIEVVHESTLAAAQRLSAEGHRPAALNFASAKHPGGGFLGGARAQEESLCRSSALHGCLDGQPMYAYHRGLGGALYSSYAIHSPEVPVFRADDGQLLAEPYPCTFLTAPAVNAGALLKDHPERQALIRPAMTERVARVLAILATHGHTTLVLGAWGCGVFRNDPRMVAELFHQALTGACHGVFDRVVFAILDGSRDEQIIGPFARTFPMGRTSPLE